MEQIYSGSTGTFSFSEVETKGEKEYYISGYISTKAIDTFNDLVTDECMSDMLEQINSGSIKIDFEHETIHNENLDINPVARIVEAKKDEKGIWVKAMINSANKRFNEMWGSIKNGFLDSFSIAFKPIDTATRYIQGKAVRLLNKLKLVNIGLTGTPVNSECKLDNIIVKALNDMSIEDVEIDEDEEFTPLDELDDTELKHKYIKRTGRPGHYEYFYRDGNVTKKRNPYKKGSQAYADFEKGQENQDKMKNAKTDKDILIAYLEGNYANMDEVVKDNYGKKLSELDVEGLKKVLEDQRDDFNLEEWKKKNKTEKPKENDKIDKVGRWKVYTKKEKMKIFIEESYLNIDKLTKKYNKRKLDDLTEPEMEEIIKEAGDGYILEQIKEEEKKLLTNIDTPRDWEIEESSKEDETDRKNDLFRQTSKERNNKEEKKILMTPKGEGSEEEQKVMLSNLNDIKEGKTYKNFDDAIDNLVDSLDEYPHLDKESIKTSLNDIKKGNVSIKELDNLINSIKKGKLNKTEKKALSTQSGLTPESYSTEQSDDNKQMAEEENQIANETNEVETPETTETEEVKTDNANLEKELEEKNKELAEVKAKMVELEKQLAKPEFKALQDTPITKLKENNVTPLGLIG